MGRYHLLKCEGMIFPLPKGKKILTIPPKEKICSTNGGICIRFTFMHFVSCCYTRSVNFDLFSIVLYEFVINHKKIIEKHCILIVY